MNIGTGQARKLLAVQVPKESKKFFIKIVITTYIIHIGPTKHKNMPQELFE